MFCKTKSRVDFACAVRDEPNNGGQVILPVFIRVHCLTLCDQAFESAILGDKIIVFNDFFLEKKKGIFCF